MNTTKSFPPADHLFTILREIDYIHHLNQFLDLVQTICIWTAAIVTVLYQRTAQWYRNGGKDKIILTWQIAVKNVKTFYQWIRYTFYPFCLVMLTEIENNYAMIVDNI